ncbi:MAG TPA: hypothetical protein VLG38_01130 [Gammaproteobacteria bacterium]|nr:hypothetical protein [Gammaproteobacteria bacterium]
MPRKIVIVDFEQVLDSFEKDDATWLANNAVSSKILAGLFQMGVEIGVITESTMPPNTFFKWFERRFKLKSDRLARNLFINAFDYGYKAPKIKKINACVADLQLKNGVVFYISTWSDWLRVEAEIAVIENRFAAQENAQATKQQAETAVASSTKASSTQVKPMIHRAEAEFRTVKGKKNSAVIAVATIDQKQNASSFDYDSDDPDDELRALGTYMRSRYDGA